MTTYLVHLANVVGIYAILALGLNIITGYGGMICLCAATFFGVGAYSFSLLLNVGGSSFLSAMALAVLATSALAGLLGAVSIWLKRDMFVMATFAVQIVASGLFNNVELTGGPNGISGIRRPEIAGSVLGTYECAGVTWLLLLAIFVFCRKLETSHFCRMLRAVREDEIFVESIGIHPAPLRIAAYCMFGAVLAVGGALYASYMGYIDPSSFTFTESMAILAIVVFGGLGNAFGAIMGTVFMTLLPEMVRSVGIDGVAAANLRQILVGVCLILALMFRPEGLFRERIIGGVGRK